MISAELKKIYASAPTDKRYVDTLEFRHPNFAKNYLFTNDTKNWEFVDENFQTCLYEMMPFRIVLPSTDNKGQQDMRLAISNIGRIMMDELEAANRLPTEPIRCIYRVYIDYRGCPPQNDPPLELTITDVVAEREQISAVARRADILNKSFPYTFYRIDKFPGLDR